jgi:hypothetical protein
MVKLNPSAVAQESPARALASAGLWEQAEKVYRRLSDKKAEVLFPHDRQWFAGLWAQILYSHGVCLSRLARQDEARQQFRSYLWVFDGADVASESSRKHARFCGKGFQDNPPAITKLLGAAGPQRIWLFVYPSPR